MPTLEDPPKFLCLPQPHVKKRPLMAAELEKSSTINTRSLRFEHLYHSSRAL
jgi:hypothetical protein